MKLRRIKKQIDKFEKKVSNKIIYKRYKKQFKRYCKGQNIAYKVKAEGEEKYIKKWAVFGKPVEPYSYRFFSHYCGHTPYIIPEDIGRTVIETILNPVDYRPYYSDKNMYSLYIDSKYLPKSFARRINGGLLLDENYNPIDKIEIDESIESLILKPTTGSDSGRGVQLFKKNEKGAFVNGNNEKLTKEYILKYNDNFILQEKISQHGFLNEFCPTSVNTIRIAVYKSVIDDEYHVFGAVLRIGKKGSFIDNAHGGGSVIGIDIRNGELKDYLFDFKGNKYSEWNGIDFSKNHYKIPYWNEILYFSKKILKNNQHLRLLALDVALDENGKPILIEYNTNAFSYWLFMLGGSPALDKFTDEIIEYCKEKYFA